MTPESYKDFIQINIRKALGKSNYILKDGKIDFTILSDIKDKLNNAVDGIADMIKNK